MIDESIDFYLVTTKNTYKVVKTTQTTENEVTVLSSTQFSFGGGIAKGDFEARFWNDDAQLFLAVQNQV